MSSYRLTLNHFSTMIYLHALQLADRGFSSRSPTFHRTLLHMQWILAIFLLNVWMLDPCDGIYIDTPPKDIIVAEGGEAKFLCLTSVLPRSEGQEALISVHWKFLGQRLDVTDQDGAVRDSVAPAKILMAEPKSSEDAVYSSDGSQKPRFRLRTFENRHVLVIDQVRPEDEGEYTCVVTYGNNSENAQGSLTIRRIPEPPLGVTARCLGGKAEVSWRPGRLNGAETTSYLVQYNLIMENPDEWFSYYEDTSGTVTVAYIELAPYGDYSFRVIARNRFGSSRPSNPTAETCTTPPDRPDRNPRHVRSRTDKKGFLVIEWEPLHRLSFHGNGFGYLVLWRKKGTYGYNSAQVEGSYASSFSHEVHDVYRLYEFQVRSKNKLGEATNPSLVYLGHSFEDEPDLTVEGFQEDKTRNVTQTTAHFVWEAVDPKDEKIHGKFKGYKILYWKWDLEEMPKHEVFIPYTGRMDGSGPVKGDLVRGAISGLPAYSVVKAQVAVVNTHYTGPPSATVDIFTREGKPSEVENLHVDKVSYNSIIIRWLPPLQPNGVLQGFDIGYQPVLDSHLGKLRVLSEQANNPVRLEAQISRLKPNHWYRIHVAARTRAGRGDLSVMDVRTSNYTGPAASSDSTLYRAHNDTPELTGNSHRSSAQGVHDSAPISTKVTVATLTLCLMAKVFHNQRIS